MLASDDWSEAYMNSPFAACSLCEKNYYTKALEYKFAFLVWAMAASFDKV